MVKMDRRIFLKFVFYLSLTGVVADISSPCWRLEPVAKVLCLVYYTKTGSAALSSTGPPVEQPTPIVAPDTTSLPEEVVTTSTKPQVNLNTIYLGKNESESEMNMTLGDSMAQRQPHSRFAPLKFPLKQKFDWKRREKRAVESQNVSNTTETETIASSATESTMATRLPMAQSSASLNELSVMDFHPTTSTLSPTTVTSTSTSTMPATTVGRVMDGKKGCICFACSSAAAGDAEPNENCSKDLHTITEAVKLNIELLPCLNQCFTNILRIGDYISTFRGCLKPKDQVNTTSSAVNSAYQIKEGGYICTKTPLMGAEWWSCTCDGHFCNHDVPNV